MSYTIKQYGGKATDEQKKKCRKQIGVSEKDRIPPGNLEAYNKCLKNISQGNKKNEKDGKGNKHDNKQGQGQKTDVIVRRNRMVKNEKDEYVSTGNLAQDVREIGTFADPDLLINTFAMQQKQKQKLKIIAHLNDNDFMNLKGRAMRIRAKNLNDANQLNLKMKKDENKHKLELAKIMAENIEKESASEEYEDKPVETAFNDFKRLVVKTAYFLRWCIKTNIVNTKSVFDLTWQMLYTAIALGYDVSSGDGVLYKIFSGLKRGFNQSTSGPHAITRKISNALSRAYNSIGGHPIDYCLLLFYVFALVIILPNVYKKWYKMPDKIVINSKPSHKSKPKSVKRKKKKSKKSIRKRVKSVIPRGSRCPSKYPNYCKHWGRTKNRCIKTNECIDHLTHTTFNGTRKSCGLGDKYTGDKCF